MTNIYFPDEVITYNDLYFVCYMIERTARTLRQRNIYVVNALTDQDLSRQLSIASTLHCLNPEQVVQDWIEEYHLKPGTFDVTAIDPEYADHYPSSIQMGKVYARLISSVTPDLDYVAGIRRVYASPICQAIDNYNTSAYYEPSYVQTRAFYNGFF